jgi:hypothetical protein
MIMRSTTKSRCARLLVCGLACAALTQTGCTGGSGSAAPPTDAQRQQTVRDLLNDPHVPDSVKQHIQDEAEAKRQAALAYAAHLKQVNRAANR